MIATVVGCVIWSAAVLLLGYLLGQRNLRRQLFGPQNDRRYYL
jgi:membrane protein DedA with SNARE-associated domain